MGIRLDWEIESEQEQMHGGAEDPEAKRRRRRAQLRFLLVFGTVIVLIGVLVGAAALRLRYVDWQIEQLLRDTFDAEIATLRLGDWAAFSEMQESASALWEETQREEFDRYQQLKVEPNTALTGEIVSAAVDGTRGRVHFREIIGGVVFERVWFYWRYEEGWRHVPPDYTFWGEADRLQTERLTIAYREVDARVAAAVRDRLDGWLEQSCRTLGCADLPHITVEIQPDPGLLPGWIDPASWTLVIPSPLVDRMRSDQPFSNSLQLPVANALAERLFTHVTSGMQMVYPTDAWYLRQAVISWLVGWLTGEQTNSFLINSLAVNYGEDAVQRFVAALQPDSSMALLQQVLGLSSAVEANLDWRDLLTWRLALEGELITRRAEVEFYTLYDTNDPAVRSAAQFRYANGVATGLVVVEAVPALDANGAPILRTTVENGTESSEVIFRLVDGVWKRAN